MYTSHIGRRLLGLYHQRTGEELSARQFFELRLYPLFYAHKRYLQWVPSSPFAQKVAAGNLAGGKTEAEVQLATLHHKIAAVAPRCQLRYRLSGGGRGGHHVGAGVGRGAESRGRRNLLLLDWWGAGRGRERGAVAAAR